MITLCTVAADFDHLIEVPLEQAQVPYVVIREGDRSLVKINPEDADRARRALERFGTFQIPECDGGER